ncbi:hypothetical protein PoB_004655700 [Plakobranchus ocellatus]|uniref:Reverse transcriptase domain-containing protein n=1 Tax=Plakobranchus ocellatus TaxID=259542 RepID=A0AAV4BKY8_9GAST|nr:hypothetical protein PoB_004655700 [Plakobranchus ocellatus]
MWQLDFLVQYKTYLWRYLKPHINNNMNVKRYSDIAKRLIVTHLIPGRFYIPPKIHKGGKPGRPIISGCSTEIISLFVDYHLKDLVRLVPSYVQDDLDFLRKIHNINELGPLPPDTILCTMDVSALYTDIPRVGACKSALEKWKDPSYTLSSTFIEIILTCNCIQFATEFDVASDTRGGHMYMYGPLPLCTDHLVTHITQN